MAIHFTTLVLSPKKYEKKLMRVRDKIVIFRKIIANFINILFFNHSINRIIQSQWSVSRSVMATNRNSQSVSQKYQPITAQSITRPIISTNYVKQSLNRSYHPTICPVITPNQATSHCQPITRPLISYQSNQSISQSYRLNNQSLRPTKYTSNE